ncbi:TonB family protein [Riemerella anatipestifer]|uniref:energy transducer TonB n=1 Tax=Riemerella anatipestifer TaxID=34085 RepID=UPI00129E486A|nr:TonB family protein [Riemerella anatipestifer]MDY3345622.1 TonB family protein [Riemerella anatipestifer]MDY3358703.1 TonB family protein [Riemerella anatipestifer]MRM83877.1 TonB family protein [Riemerella anatipestifer]
MKTKNLLTIVALLSYLFVRSQIVVYEEYPNGQNFYVGGEKEFYKDFHSILLEHKLSPCENKKEFYTMKLVIYPDRSIKYIKPENLDDVEANKCTFQLTKEVLKYMDKWKPAIVDNKEVAAVAYITIIPDNLFDKYTDGYTIDSVFKRAEYEGGINLFRKKIFQSIDISGFHFNGSVELLVKFMVEKDGSLSNIRIENSSGSEEFDKRIIDGVTRVKNKWKPGTLNGEPIRVGFNLPIKIQAN